MAKDIFLSHAWGFDEYNRDNHKRCLEIYNILTDSGFLLWIDESDMKSNIDLSIINGIDDAKIILLCLTKKYCDKINYSVYNNMPQDNCYKEWNYSIFRQKYIIPVLMEEQMKNIYMKEKGIIQMYLNNMLFIDASSDLDYAVKEIINRLKEYNLYASITPNNSNNSLFDYFNQISPKKRQNRNNSPNLYQAEVKNINFPLEQKILHTNIKQSTSLIKKLFNLVNIFSNCKKNTGEIIIREKTRNYTFKLKKKSTGQKNINSSENVKKSYINNIVHSPKSERSDRSENTVRI